MGHICPTCRQRLDGRGTEREGAVPRPPQLVEIRGVDDPALRHREKLLVRCPHHQWHLMEVRLGEVAEAPCGELIGEKIEAWKIQ